MNEIVAGAVKVLEFKGKRMKKRNYTQETVRKLQGSLQIEHTLAKRGAAKLRVLLANEPYINTLGAYNGQMAVQHAKAEIGRAHV